MILNYFMRYSLRPLLPELSYDKGITLNLNGKLLQRFRWRPGKDASRQVIGPGMARTEQPFFFLLVVYETPQVSANPGKYDIPLIRPVDDDARGIIENDFFPSACKDIGFAQDERF